MLYRKIETAIRQALAHPQGRTLIVEGARQVGKSYIIRKVGEELYHNFIELNLIEDALGPRLFASVRTVGDFYLRLSMVAGERLGTKDDTLVFLDEIQQYPHLLTLLKFLQQQTRYQYVASGSLLGLTLHQSTSIPIGSIEIIKMYPLDFEEFLMANSIGKDAIDMMHIKFKEQSGLETPLHARMMDLFRKYLTVGGMPQVVQEYVNNHNIVTVRQIQADIRRLYGADAAKYDEEHRLKIQHIYQLIPSIHENKKKRVVFKDIENQKVGRYKDYLEEFDYLVDAGIAIEVQAVSNPVFPLLESARKNLFKLYLNDVGLLTEVLYGRNLSPLLDADTSVNLGTVYESCVAQELLAHGYVPYYYDNKSHGEVDYLIDEMATATVCPIEVKSGKDYKVHSALTAFVNNPYYQIQQAYVLCNQREVVNRGAITYMPVYYIMFIQPNFSEGSTFF